MANYDFASRSRLRGVGIGGSSVWRSKPLMGFFSNGSIVDQSIKYWGEPTLIFNAWVSYKRKVWKDKARWRLQVNVQNLFNDDLVVPLRGGRDSNNRFIFYRSRLSTPRNVVFSSSVEI
jgi:outer membrane receptor protein involved in Fe transport